jgi:tetratricopeptide (TPR) repeat protein
MKRLAKIIIARAPDFLLVAILLFCGVLLVRKWLPRSVVAKGPDLTFVDHPATDGMEPIVRDQIHVARAKCDELTATNATRRERGRAWGELGKVYLTYSHSRPAAGCFQNAQALDPDEFRWSYLLAHALERDGTIDEAAGAMQRALKVLQTDAAATPQDQLAGVCFLGDMMVRLNRPIDARRTFEAALAAHPKCAFVLVNLGQLATEAGEPEAAVGYFQRALEVLPGRAEVRRLLAAAYRRQGDVAKAAEYATPGGAMPAPVQYPDPLLAAVTELDRSAKRQNRLGVEHSSAGRNQQAALCFARALQADPENTAAHGNLGIALLKLGRIEEAVQHLEEARRRNPQSEEFRSGLILAHVRQPGAQQIAIDDALAWRKEQPRNLQALNILAQVYFEIQRYLETLNISGEAVRIDPAQPSPFLEQARALAALGRHAEARDRLEQAVKTFPDDETVRHTLARFLVACPDDKQRDAVRGLKLSQELFAGLGEVVIGETLALALAENGQFDEAVKRQRWAVQTCGDQAGPALRQRLERELKCLEARQPYREPWPFCNK